MDRVDGDKRRQQIMEILNQETSPVSGAELAKRAGVSRQVVVQDGHVMYVNVLLMQLMIKSNLRKYYAQKEIPLHVIWFVWMKLKNHYIFLSSW